MAAINLSPVAEFPSGYTHTLDTVWQAFTLDPRTEVVSVSNEHGTIGVYVAFDSMGLPATVETPADNGAVGSHRFLVPAGVTRAWRVKSVSGASCTDAVYVAGVSGTPVCTVAQELGPA